jgi:uncharacterized RDD family membrane protein YckC
MVVTPMTPNGLPLSTIGKRLGAYLLDGLLAIVTLIIGYLIWSVIVWSKGQTPAKQLLGMRVVRPETGLAVGWGGMFVREFLVKGLLVWVISTATLGIGGIVAPLLILGGTMRQTLWDRICNTVVVEDPTGHALPVYARSV